MAQALERTTVERVGRWLKWKLLRVIQLSGFTLVAIGAYPFMRPFAQSIFSPPAAVDSFIAAFYPVKTFGIAPIPSLRGVVFIALGLVAVWVATSRRFF